jgi:hypothetical protein
LAPVRALAVKVAKADPTEVAREKPAADRASIESGKDLLLEAEKTTQAGTARWPRRQSPRAHQKRHRAGAPDHAAATRDARQ